MLLLLTAIGCIRYDDVPQAHKGRYFDKKSLVCTGGYGLSGPVLEPGSYNVGLCDELRLVECALVATKESMQALTRDGVQFGLDVYVTYSANCDDPKSVESMFSTLVPSERNIITADQLWSTFLRPGLGESVRETISPYVANDINDQREAILADIRSSFLGRMSKLEPPFVRVTEINLSNMDFPETMDQANTERATQAVLKDKAIAERERVGAEIETAKLRQQLAAEEGRVEAARIEQIGAALSRNPAFLQYQLQQQLPNIYEKAGASGNLVIAAPNPMLLK